MRYCVRPPMRIPTAMTMRPKATEARTVIRLALELMGFLHRSWLGIPPTLAMIMNCEPGDTPCQEIQAHCPSIPAQQVGWAKIER
jgi:hypothetical protein